VKLAELARWAMAAVGTLLWLTLVVILQEGGNAKYLYRCRGRSPTGGVYDDCFGNDYLPILEVVVAPTFILLTAFFFARFAFLLFSPPAAERRLKWRMAGRTGAADSWPIPQIVACVGVAWALWRLFTYPLAAELLPFHLYWGAFAAWFGLGALVGLLDERRARST
jgi:hypothetical protein